MSFRWIGSALSFDCISSFPKTVLAGYTFSRSRAIIFALRWVLSLGMSHEQHPPPLVIDSWGHQVDGVICLAVILYPADTGQFDRCLSYRCCTLLSYGRAFLDRYILRGEISSTTERVTLLSRASLSIRRRWRIGKEIIMVRR